MLAPSDMDTIISDGQKLVAELVQPRQSIVRLYLGGRRGGYQPLAAGGDVSAPVPAARLRLGVQRLGLITMVTPSSLAVQDVEYCSSANQRLIQHSLEPTSTVEAGKIYVHQVSD